MQLGTFKVPDMRLDIVISETLKKIYESVKTDEIQSKDLSQLLGYKFGTEPTLFKRINSMLAYGVLEGSRGTYNITQLGEDLLFPEPDREQDLKTQAIMNVGLWKELFKKNKKELPKNGLWVQLKNITKVDPDTAKKTENRISGWYAEDMALVSNDIVMTDTSQEPQSQPVKTSSKVSQTASLGQLTVPTIGTIEINDEDTLTIARSYLSVLEKKIKEKKTHSQEIPDDVPTSDEATDDVVF